MARAGGALLPPIVLGMALLAFGCTDDKGKGQGDTGEGGGGGGGGGDDTGETDLWRAMGAGEAYLVDGKSDNSLFTLDLENTTPPRDGEQYWGWLTGGASDIELGAIEVTGDTVFFQGEIGLNGLLEGYDSFEAWAGPDSGARETGDALWHGEIDPSLKSAYEDLLLSSSDTPDGEGSVRTVETTAETTITYAQEAIDQSLGVTEIYDIAEAVHNAITGGNEDVDGDGTTHTIDGVMPILGDDGLILLILEDLDAASAAVEPGHPIKDLANYAYDCTQRIEEHAEGAATQAGLATVCGSEDACDGYLAEAIEHLQYTLEGYDTNGDDEIDLEVEGTIECAVFFVSQMAYMDVTSH